MSDYKNIRNMDNASQMWDWAPYNDCFGGKIRMGDIDGMVERKGYFLFVETKRPDIEITQGQSIAYERLAACPQNTVIYIWGELNKPVKLQYVGDPMIHMITSVEDVKRHFSEWYKKIDAMEQYDPTPKTISKASVFAWLKERLWFELHLLKKWITEYLDEMATTANEENKAA